ncbi:MAG: hypothetical protein JW889_07650 [Verrucomicrobia bacterium]|nr:hypothetical protein [Verrucomicrobiota bacterium]
MGTVHSFRSRMVQSGFNLPVAIRRSRLRVLAILAAPALLVAGAVHAGPQDAAKPMAHCEVRPLPTEPRRLEHMPEPKVRTGADAAGLLYLTMTYDRTYCWDGAAFVRMERAPDENAYSRLPLVGGELVGGYNRGLYLTQSINSPSRSALYRLEDGKAKFVTEYDVPRESGTPWFYVSRSGLIIRWTSKGLSVFHDGTWHDQAMGLDRYRTAFLDDGETLFVFCSDQLCRVDKDGRITMREFPTAIAPEERNSWMNTSVLWGNCILFFRSNMHPLTTTLLAHDLTTGKEVDTSGLADALKGRAVRDAFTGPDGVAWLWTKGAEGHVLFMLTPEGDAFALEDTGTIDWGYAQSSEHPVLPLEDGSFWLAQPHGGLVLIEKGRVRQFGWRDGVGICSSVAAGPDGALYAVDKAGVHAFHRDEALPAPAWAAAWDEYLTWTLRPVRDSAGNIWISSVEDSETMSLWDGTQWSHLDLSFDMSEAQVAVADDTGHVLIQMRRPQNDCLSYDLSATGVERYETIQATLEAAVTRGATRFDRDAYVDAAGVIWMRQAAVNWVYRFDHGDRQIMYSDNGQVLSMMSSAKHDIMTQDTQDEFYVYKGDDLHKLAPKPGPGSRWLLGRNGLQPFEAKLYEAAPNEYVVIDYSEGGNYYLAVPVRGADGSITFERGDAVPPPTHTALTPGLYGGHWARSNEGTTGVRYFGGRALPLAREGSPLEAMLIFDVLEDKAHNVWFDAGVYGGFYGAVRHVFVRRVAGFRLDTTTPPTTAGDRTSLKASVVHDGQAQEGWRFFYRLRASDGLDGEWQGGNPGPFVLIKFPADGTYEVEVIGMGPLGETTPESVTFTVESKAQ